MISVLSRYFRKVVGKILVQSQAALYYGDVKDWLAYYRSENKKHHYRQENKRSGICPKVSIIILTYNNLPFNQLCLESIYANTDYPDFEVVVVDNASTDETPQWLMQYAQLHPNLHLILNSENRGFAGGNNQAAKLATGEFLIFLNNDTVVTSGWVDGLLNHMQRDLRIGLIGPVTNSTGNEARIVSTYTSPNEMEKFAGDRSQKMAGLSFDIRMLAFYCVMARKDQYEAFGGLDERYAVGMFEDDDLAVQYHLAGYKVVCAEDVFIHHFQGTSFGKLEDIQYSKIFEENRRKYEEKWNKKWEPYQLRPEVMQYLHDIEWGKANYFVSRKYIIFGLIFSIVCVVLCVLLWFK